MAYHQLENKTEIENVLIETYFAFTTLSTVGFGDFYPKSDSERLIWTFILLIGVSMFSYIMGNFLEVLDNYNLVTAQNEDADNLSRFFGLMHKFNGGRALKRTQIEEIEEYFDYYWANDKRYCLNDDEDKRFFVELPKNIKT